jgi:hypothetical protein
MCRCGAIRFVVPSTVTVSIILPRFILINWDLFRLCSGLRATLPRIFINELIRIKPIPLAVFGLGQSRTRHATVPVQRHNFDLVTRVRFVPSQRVPSNVPISSIPMSSPRFDGGIGVVAIRMIHDDQRAAHHPRVIYPSNLRLELPHEVWAQSILCQRSQPCGNSPPNDKKQKSAQDVCEVS